MSVTERVDRYQQRHRRAGFPIAVIYKYFDDQGNYLAALITFYGFVSVFPLLLLLSSVLGFLLQGHPGLEQHVLDSTLSQFPVIGDQLSDPQGLTGSMPAVIIGAVTSLYGALGVAQAIQNAANIAWAVPRNRRPNPLLARVRSLLLLAVGGVALLATTVLSALGSGSYTLGSGLGMGLKILATFLSVCINAVVFIFAFRISTAHRLPWRDAAPGAIFAALIAQALQSFGAPLVGYVVNHASKTNGTFALVLGLLAWIYIGAVGLVLSIEINVVRTKHFYPRALLAPFTDDVDLTRGDQKAYTSYATAQQTKGFESVDVDFANEGQNATAKRDQKRRDGG